MYQNLKKKTEGFTIIEVLIVLAIAALIMLIVFIAVPALQRNARNNELRNQASRLATATVEFRTNANNELPQNGASSTAGSDAATLLNMANIDPSESVVTVVSATPPSEPDAGDFNVIAGSATCNSTRVDVQNPVENPRSVAVEFGLDGGGTGCIVS